ncbi:endoglucanase IV [Pyrenophora tritici-repentis]|uniref:Glyco-hydro-61 domain containing protein n=2 Tax=Pyrenophora tritici-repentis TaxID=45151 RepID=A0A2W1FP16_9PLEO|nr:endoglucanase IV [Pyrenophora tritici-repentis Pt-1C-BFP]KAA8618571.1 Endoglucanase IV [Pyrenophora tritici-repentis]EDU48430.1 endoglucanase IV [Pyrenophora tritici-repentis Pt-1C-BFP]KAF7449045.1 Endoglucanase IV [Pyrenophora tritici-repentis]KAF7570957.1 Glyco-hydro-61 multi-domain protein [Pyrenophora tritici-repentis]KAG9384014.1 Endoglucanase IV [Pyrenophora tritici-repentis]
MYASALLLGALAVLLDTASAHGFVKGVNIKGTFTNGSDPLWIYAPKDNRPKTAGWDALNQDIGFVEPANAGTADVNCHKSATAGKLYANVNPGDTIEFVWNTWPVGHTGPIINYIAPCNGDCSTLSSTALRWSKITQSAIVSPGTWITDLLIKNNFKTSMILPAKLAPGNYVIRHEIIALHAASNVNGAQLYPQCINLKVGGSGTVAPTGGVPGTSLYTKELPGLVFNVYTNPTTYPFPGPALWTAAN